MALEQVQAGVEGLSQPQTLDQLLAEAQAGAGEPVGLVGQVVVDVLVEEHGAAAVALELGVESPLDAALAFAEATS